MNLEAIKAIHKRHSLPDNYSSEREKLECEIERTKFDLEKMKFFKELLGSMEQYDQVWLIAKEAGISINDAMDKFKAMDTTRPGAQLRAHYSNEKLEIDLDNILSIDYEPPSDYGLIFFHLFTLYLFYAGIRKFPEYTNQVLLQKADFATMKLVKNATLSLTQYVAFGHNYDQKSVRSKLAKERKIDFWRQAVNESYFRVINNVRIYTQIHVQRMIREELKKAPKVKEWLQKNPKNKLPSLKSIGRRLQETDIDLKKILLSKKN